MEILMVEPTPPPSMTSAPPAAVLDAARVELESRPAHKATRSIAPWLVHRRMIPKWVGFVVTGAATLIAPAPQQLWIYLLGVALFFPSEYVVHRGVFHFFADKNVGKVLSKQHVAHHIEPDDLDFLFNDPRISVSVGVLYFLICLAVTQSLGQSTALSFGNFSGLLYYEHVHFSAHRPGSRPWTPWGRYMKKFHLWHHFKHERLWFGVTSPIFDHLLRSYRRQTDVQPSPTVRTLVPTAEQREWMGDP